MNNVAERENRRIQLVLAVLFGLIFALSLLPIAMVAPYARATGDDLNYGAGVRQVVLNGGNIFAVFQAAAATAKGAWFSWQGTWSSVMLFSLQPGVWGDAWYPVTIAVALLSILGGTWYFLDVAGRRRKISAAGRWSVFFLTGLLLIQYMPNMKCGVFWWTSVAHYCIPYGVALLSMGWSLRWLETGGWGFLAGMLLGMGYLGGAGYPEVVLAAVWFFCLPWYQYCVSRRGAACREKRDNDNKGRAFVPWIPLAVEMAGFAVSAAAPGNKKRGGEDFGFSVQRVIRTLVSCGREGIEETVRYFLSVRALLPVLLVIVLLLILCSGAFSGKRTALGWKRWGLALIGGLAMVCIVRAPVIYAGVDASGGCPDSYWFITVVAIVWWLEILVSAGVKTSCDESRRKTRRQKICLAGIAGIMVLLLLLSRHLVGGSVDYTCVRFIRGGALADYHEQMEEWLSILNDPDVTDAELPEMNDEQGPFMLMVPLDDPTAWSSEVYARYYGKQSVICVPRNTIR